MLLGGRSVRLIGGRLERLLSWRRGYPALAVLVLTSVLLCWPGGGNIAPAHGDVPDHLCGASHLNHDLTYSMQPFSEPQPSRRSPRTTGAFNLVAYACVSLNIPLYQMTAMPAIALATAVMLTGRATATRLPRRG